MAGILTEEIHDEIKSRFTSLSKLPENDLEFQMDSILAGVAVDIAGERHCGKIKMMAGPFGEVTVQEGKDLSEVRCVIGTGGPLVFAKDPASILQKILFQNNFPHVLRPKEARLYLDHRYALYAIGLLSQTEPKKALRIMKKTLLPLS